MSLTEITGDLFAVPGLDALAHGVNCQGVMGAGIAVRFRERSRAMFEEYQRRCDDGELRLGGVFEWWDSERGQYLYNLATQPRPGRCASLHAIDAALSSMVLHARGMKVFRIGMPMIGCGLGGLDWRDVRPLVERAAQHVDIVVVEWAKGAKR